LRRIVVGGTDSNDLNSGTYVKVTAAGLWDNLPLILLAGLLLSVVCVPSVVLYTMELHAPAPAVGVLTIPAGWAALLALEAEALSGRKTTIIVMVKAFGRLWGRSVLLGLLAVVPVVSGVWVIGLLGMPEVPPVAWVGLIADVFGLIVLLPLYLYAFPQIALYDLRVGVALSNSMILASNHISNTLGLLGMGLLFGFSVAYASSGLLFVLPAVWGAFVVNNCRMLVEEELGQA
jgi:uncharacterized membrane protein YesL